jgi:hypothetical protein
MTMTEYDPIASWDELCPAGARRFYEGDDPEGFRAEMWQEFGFEVAADDPWYRPGGYEVAVIRD